jgi:hypothetical protein
LLAENYLILSRAFIDEFAVLGRGTHASEQ